MMTFKFDNKDKLTEICEYLVEGNFGIAAEILSDSVASFSLNGHGSFRDLNKQYSLKYHSGEPYSKNRKEILTFGVMTMQGNDLMVLTEPYYRKLEVMKEDRDILLNHENKRFKETGGRIQALIDIFMENGEHFLSTVDDLKHKFPDYNIEIMCGRHSGGK